MCGRYQLSTEDEIFEIREIMKELNRQVLSGVKTGEIYPSEVAAVLISGEGDTPISGAVPRAMRWGFPKWDGKGRVINARIETADEKPMFKHSFKGRRCVIPSTGFFEWSHPKLPDITRVKQEDMAVAKQPKEKYLLKIKGEDALFMAGIYREGEEAVFTILTTAANESVSALHDRMPVILHRSEISSWLSEDFTVPELREKRQPELSLHKQEKSNKDSRQISMFQ